jgi:type I restriction-modification system DNA methylase subunit
MREPDIKKGTDFQTPHSVAEYMVSLIPEGAKKILEPTPGSGNIVTALHGYNVIAPKDYFLLYPDRYDCIVMNPPFSSKYAYLDNAKMDYTKHGMRLGYQILVECMEMSDNVIALMPWFTISDSDVRLRFLKKYGIISLTALPRKTFQYARIQTVILQLQKGWGGDTLFKTFSF